ncbi:hypothetical protein CXB51_019130 [Gossypium anomalum]|uniref:DDE Tnp4 domain-containing protein n=1 Tax=Gossypium anomalum TaxID=47600 RepID=A0A8J5YZ48_9ROSI|nr:hypothetical protein CXB51_019130 [Gossypium anomalum]
MNYDTPELRKEPQRRIATIVTQVQHNNYHEEEEQVLSSILLHHETYFTKQPCMDSNYTGQMWVDEVLNGHDDRCMNSFRMPKNIFHSLLHDLQTNYGLKHGKSRKVNSRKYRTIFARMGIDTIKPIEGQFEEVPNHIRHDTRYWPHFKDCIGAIDGTHIKACISPSCQIPYIGRKGEPTQNIMAVYDFNMCFIFAFPGWEGTAHDSRIFLQALRKQQLKFPHPPPGKYYLVDSGYPQMAGFLGPYRGERYHLPDFHRGNHRASGKKEIFNHAHSSLRSVIERTFGVWKKKWPILRDIPSYSFDKQVLIVIATMVLHNYIRRHAWSNDEDFRQFENIPDMPISSGHFNRGESSSSNSESDLEIAMLRETIANSLMNQYL